MGRGGQIEHVGVVCGGESAIVRRLSYCHCPIANDTLPLSTWGCRRYRTPPHPHPLNIPCWSCLPPCARYEPDSEEGKSSVKLDICIINLATPSLSLSLSLSLLPVPLDVFLYFFYKVLRALTDRRLKINTTTTNFCLHCL